MNAPSWKNAVFSAAKALSSVARVAAEVFLDAAPESARQRGGEAADLHAVRQRGDASKAPARKWPFTKTSLLPGSLAKVKLIERSPP